MGLLRKKKPKMLLVSLLELAEEVESIVDKQVIIELRARTGTTHRDKPPEIIQTAKQTKAFLDQRRVDIVTYYDNTDVREGIDLLHKSFSKLLKVLKNMKESVVFQKTQFRLRFDTINEMMSSAATKLDRTLDILEEAYGKIALRSSPARLPPLVIPSPLPDEEEEVEEASVIEEESVVATSLEEAKRLFAFAEHIYYLTEPDKRWWNIKARDVKVRASLRDFREQMEVSLEEWKGGSSIIRSETETAEEEKTKQEQKNTQATTAKVESEAKTIEVEAERGRSKSGGTLHERSRGRRFTISSTDDDDEVTARYEDSDDKSSYLSAPSLPPPSPPSSPPRTTTTAPLFPPPTKSAPHPPASEAKEWRRRHALSEHLREEERKRRLRLEGGIEGGAEVALKYLEVASEAGYGPATYLLAAAVRRGYGDRSRNPRKAKMLLELAAEQEDGDALFEMAMIEAGDEAELRDGPFYRSPETEEKSGVGPREDSFSAALRHLESVGEERERAAERDERRWHSRGVGTEGMGEHAEKGQWDLDFLLPPSKYGYLEHSSEGVRDDVPLGRYRESKLEANRSAANLDRAAHLFWRAVQSSGHVESAFRLGCLLEKGAIHVPLSDGRRRRFSGEEEEAERIRDAIALYRYVRRCAEESGGYHEGATNNLACLLYRCPSSLLSPSLQGSKAEAIALFRELEDRGGGIAANHLGIAIEEREWSPGVQEENRSTDGGVVVVDEEEKPKRQERKEKEAALRYYKLSHERGHVAGSLNAGRVLVELERHSEAEQYLQRAAAADEGQAYYLLAKIAEKEAGEREERKKWRDKERERIDHMARTLAKAPEDEESERTGAAVESKGGSVASLSTPDLWRRWQYYLERALERGVREAALEAGLVQYERAVRGDRGPGAFERVAELFAAGARFGSAEAMNQLGILYEEGRGVPLSLTRAAQLYAAAADLDHPMGLFNRGMALWEGRGADHNPLQARLLFKRFGQIEVTDDRKAAVLRPVYTFAAFAGLTTALQAAELGCVPAWQWMVEHSEDAETEVFGRKLFDGRPPVGAGQSQER